MRWRTGLGVLARRGDVQGLAFGYSGCLGLALSAAVFLTAGGPSSFADLSASARRARSGRGLNRWLNQNLRWMLDCKITRVFPSF